MRLIFSSAAACAVMLAFAQGAQAQSFGGPPYYNGSLGLGGYIFGGALQGDPNLGDNFDRTANVSVMERPHPDYAPLGISVGQFTIFPSITTSLHYDDNIYAENLNTKGDEIFDLRGHVEADSHFTTNTLNIFADVRQQSYDSYSSENSTTYDAGSHAVYTINRNTFFSVDMSYDHDIEPRTAVNGNLNSVSPIQYDNTSVSAAIVHDFDRLRIRGNAAYSYVSYDNNVTSTGAEVFESYRNHNEYSGNIEADYVISPQQYLYVIGRATDDNYDLRPPAVPNNRDSTGEEIDFGGDLTLPQLLKGRLEVGYFSKHFDSVQQGTVSGPDVHGNIQYFPTQLTTVTLGVTRDFHDSGIVQAPSYLSTQTNIRLDHELLRNLIITGQVGYENDDFNGYGRTDNRITAYLGGTYLLNRRVGIRVLYNFIHSLSSGVDHSINFDDDNVTASLVLSY